MMCRPTDSMPYSLPEGIYLETPTEKDIPEIAETQYKANLGGVAFELFGEDSLEHIVDGLKSYSFKYYGFYHYEGMNKMSIIKTHDITLYGGNDEEIVLRPLSDKHLPLLYKWNSDEEVTYYTESSVGLKHNEETVRRKYSGVSQEAFCFLVEVNSVPIGECWLQKMNKPDVIAMYSDATDIRRIDMCIGEKEYWNRGIGTQFIGMMIDFAFNREHVTILHCFCEDYNKRSEKMWQKHGFTLVRKDKQTYNPQWKSPIGEYQYHYRLTRQEYISRYRYSPNDNKNFSLSLSKLADKWCNLISDASVVIVTDSEQLTLANELKATILNTCEIILWNNGISFLEKLQALRPCDLTVALFSFNTFVQGANRYFSPFDKPKGVAAKYAFIRLGISKESLLQGLETPKKLMYSKIEELSAYKPGSKLRVTNQAGTDIVLETCGFSGCDNEITSDGGMAFLPPSEVSAEVKPGTANGKIVVDVTVGQLYHYKEFLGYFGLVETPVTLFVEDGNVTHITGGGMGEELKEKLFALPIECRELVELGHGLSKMKPTGLIGVDESIIDTCHFGIGNGGKCGVHLDVVVGEPIIKLVE